MATTYFDALSAAIDFLNDHGFDNEEVIDKLNALRAQKATKAKGNKKSAARVKNEELAHIVADAIRAHGGEVRASWVRDNVSEIVTTPKAVAVLNVGVELGIIQNRKVEKSATRSELLYSVTE